MNESTALEVSSTFMLFFRPFAHCEQVIDIMQQIFFRLSIQHSDNPQKLDTYRLKSFSLDLSLIFFFFSSQTTKLTIRLTNSAIRLLNQWVTKHQYDFSGNVHLQSAVLSFVDTAIKDHSPNIVGFFRSQFDFKVCFLSFFNKNVNLVFIFHRFECRKKSLRP